MNKPKDFTNFEGDIMDIGLIDEKVTLRDYFAATVLNGFFSNGGTDILAAINSCKSKAEAKKYTKNLSGISYEFANAMLAERNNQ